MTRVSCTEDEELSPYSNFPRSSSCKPCYFRDDSDIGHGHSDLKSGDSDDHESGLESSVESLNTAIAKERRLKAFKEVMKSYDQVAQRIESLKEAKSRILGYTPGAWIEKAGSISVTNYEVPKTTSLVVIGPKGSGKSSLINRITKMIEGDQFAPERAQVAYDGLSEEGTFFVNEYMVPRGSSSFCLYDTRGFNCYNYDHGNRHTIKVLMSYGLLHGEPTLWKSDNRAIKNRLKGKARGQDYRFSKIRTANYVIFVVSALDVLKSMKGDKSDLEVYDKMIAAVFGSPYLSFKDDKPAVVITHGDLLSMPERVRVRVHLGELLGVPPDKQIFDIPDSFDAITELTVIDMLRYCLEHADKNLKTVAVSKWLMDPVETLLNLLIICLVCSLVVQVWSLGIGY